MLWIAAAAMPSVFAMPSVTPAKAGIQGPATRVVPPAAGPAGIPEVR